MSRPGVSTKKKKESAPPPRNNLLPDVTNPDGVEAERAPRFDADEAAKALTKRDETRRRYRAFAFAYADPAAAGFRNPSRAYLIAYGEKAIEKNARQMGYALLRKPYVKALIEQIQERVAAATELTAVEYVQLLLEREKHFSFRGDPGDAAAAAKILHDVGVASGFLVTKIDAKVDMPNLPSASDIVTAVIEAGERLKRLNQPNPIALPAGSVTVEGQTVDAELIDAERK